MDVEIADVGGIGRVSVEVDLPAEGSYPRLRRPSLLHSSLDNLRVLCVHEVVHTVIRSAQLPFTSSRATYILISPNGLVDIARGELVQLLVMSKDDDGDVD